MDQRKRIAVIAFVASVAAGGVALAFGAPGVLATIGAAAAGALAAFLAAEREDAAKPEAATPPVRRGGEETALLALPAPVALIGADTQVVVVNAAAQELFGPPGADGRLISFIRSPDLLEMVEAVLTDGEPRELAFTHLRTRTERPILARIRALAPGGRALIQFEDQSEARRLAAMRETFIADASHELKTPLASIIGFIETLQGPAKDDAKARDRFLDIMANQAERMRRLIEDLMSLNRIELRAHNRPSGSVDLGALAHESAAALTPVAEAAGATISVTAPEEGAAIPGDRDQIAQLIFILIDNAVKYGGKGATVEVSIATPQPEWPGMTGLTVADDGPGLAREHIPRLTERFYRVDAARSRAVGGTGLGLAIAKHILQRHRGELSVKSKPGEGAAFTIWLPDGA